jgi:hypothetical protein
LSDPQGALAAARDAGVVRVTLEAA